MDKPVKREVNVLDNLAQMTEVAVDAFMQIANKTLKDKDQFVIALSGGQTPINFYQKVSQIKNCLIWGKMSIFIVDERFVPLEHKDSNFKIIKENLCDHFCIGTGLVHYVHAEEKTPEKAAELYEKDIKDFFKLKEGELPEFDLIMLGLGEDGHTASLFPGGPGLDDDKHLAVSVHNEMVEEKDRITLTLPVINNAKCVILMANGKRKAEAVKRVLEDNDPSLPTTHVNPTHGELIFLIDQEAASLLSNSSKEV